MFYKKWFLWTLVIVNAIGTVWGIFWYWDQIRTTPWYLLPVVPDSPLHAMLFGIFIYFLATERLSRIGGFTAFIVWAGVLGVIKYGSWTLVVLSQYFISQGMVPSLEDWMLYLSHGGMAIQGIVYSLRLPKRILAAGLAVFWLAINDIFDYTIMTHPRLPLADQVASAAWTNALLTLGVAIIAIVVFRTKNKTAE